MTFEQLKALWIAQGGNPAYASIMAAIALAESTGDPTNTTGDNGTSWGLWQIHWTVHPQFNKYQLTDPGYNAKAAMSLCGNQAGSTTSCIDTQGAQTPWTTWNEYVSGQDTRASRIIAQYLGPYNGTIPKGSSSGSPPPSSSGSGSSQTPTQSGQSSTNTNGGLPSWLPKIPSDPLGIGAATQQALSVAVVAAFSITALLIGGIWLIMGNESTRTAAVDTTKTAAKAAELAG
jgi:Lysozyme like domain